MSFLVVENKENYFISDLLRLCGRVMNKALNHKEAVNSVTVDSEVSFSLNLVQILVNVNILNFERHNKNILTGVFF